MTDLIDAYQAGQVSRRTFIRRLLASGVSLASALVYADTLWGAPAHASGNFDDFYRPDGFPHDAEIFVSDFAFTPSFVAVGQGAVVLWRFPQGHSHEVDGPGTFFDTAGQNDPGSDPNEDRWRRLFPSAGTFRYRCPETTHALMEGAVQVPMQRDRDQGKTGSDFLIVWSSQGDLHDQFGPYVFDVELKKPRRRRADGGGGGGGSVGVSKPRRPKWKPWQTGITAPSALYTPKREGRHRFRARLRRISDGQASDWSPVISIRAT
jgi:plastocyanin